VTPASISVANYLPGRMTKYLIDFQYFFSYFHWGGAASQAVRSPFSQTSFVFITPLLG